MRRINLRGFAVGRFRIEEVLRNGFCDDEGSSFEGDDHKFILVEASRVNYSISTDQKSKYIAYVENEISGAILDDKDSLFKSGVQVEEDIQYEPSLMSDKFAPWFPQEIREMSKNDDAVLSGIQSMDRALKAWRRASEDGNIDEQRQELYSFDVLSRLVSKMPAIDMVEMLETRSTVKRLEYVKRKCNKKRFWNPFD